MRNTNLALKVGLLIVTVSWFAFTFYHFVSGLSNYSSSMRWYIALTEILGSVGLGFRTGASFIALVTVVSYFFLKNIGKLEALMAAKLIILIEAVFYAVTYIPSAFWGVSENPFDNRFGQLAGNMVVNFIPCLVEGFLISVVLIVLYVKLDTRKPQAGALKWGLIALATYAFAYWLTNSCNWIYAVMHKGTAYITAEPLNSLSFAVTTVGMLALAIVAAYFAKNSKATSWRELNFGRIGAIVTLLGLYFAGTYLMWILAGSVGGWSLWYTWFLGHNVDLWVMALPIIGLPILFYQKTPE